MVSRELTSNITFRIPDGALPPPPTVSITNDALTEGKGEHAYLQLPGAFVKPRGTWSRCGFLPSPNVLPYWLYTQSNDDQIERDTHIRNISKRLHTPRLQNFIQSVRIEPNMIELPESEQQESPYRSPRISRFYPNPVSIPQVNYSSDRVESTLTDCLSRIVHGVRKDSGSGVCLLGLTAQERETLCWRLELAEFNVLTGFGWKSFASHLMDIMSDDLDMIDEFSCKYRYQVVEVVLDHWYKLCTIGSPKCRRSPAIKSTIKGVLVDMDRINLLHNLGWIDD